MDSQSVGPSLVSVWGPQKPRCSANLHMYVWGPHQNAVAWMENRSVGHSKPVCGALTQ